MNGQGEGGAHRAGKRAGPQGTQLFDSEELSTYAGEVQPAPDGRASAQAPVLEGVGGSLAGRRFVLRAGRQTVGRRGDNDIVLEDLSVSSSHAWIMNQQRHYAILNTLSTNGTFVNGKRIHESALRHGDRVRFGQAEFVFLTRERGEVRRRAVRGLTVSLLLVLAGAAAAWWILRNR